MILYAVIMFAAAVIFLWLGIAIYRGNTRLINDYHQKRIKEEDLRDYGRAFAKGMFIMCGGLAASGFLSLPGEDWSTTKVSLAALFAGLIAGIAVIIRVQKRFNGGVF